MYLHGNLMFKLCMWTVSCLLQNCLKFTPSICGSVGVQDLACDKWPEVPSDPSVLSGCGLPGEELLLQGLPAPVVCTASVRASHLTTPHTGAFHPHAYLPAIFINPNTIWLLTTKSLVHRQVGSDSFHEAVVYFLCEDPSWVCLVWQCFSSWSAALKLPLLRWASEGGGSSMTDIQPLLEKTLQVWWMDEWVGVDSVLLLLWLRYGEDG